MKTIKIELIVLTVTILANVVASWILYAFDNKDFFLPLTLLAGFQGMYFGWLIREYKIQKELAQWQEEKNQRLNQKGIK